jgi:oligopeptide/dipeptide ABC transporter ATP-binding protein
MTGAPEQPFAGNEPPLLEVAGLRTHFRTPRGVLRAVDGVNLRVARGEILGIVGESGSGKSVLAQSIVRVVPPSQLAHAQGAVRFDGIDLMGLDDEGMRALRGARIAMVTQNPSTALNPVFQVRSQMLETWRFHPDRRRSGIDAESRMLELLAEVQLPAPERVARSYPFQLSGGMKQRVAIAMALMGEPDLLIADEPTTALDVTIQAQILELIRNARQTHGTAVILITHDLGVVARLCDTVAVMYAGRIVEYNRTRALFERPAHPYTRGLLASNPIFGRRRASLTAMPGQPPDLLALPAGCAFAPRCSQAEERCRREEPPVVVLPGGFHHRCPVAGELNAAHTAESGPP